MSISISEKTASYSPYNFLTDPALCAEDFLNTLHEDVEHGRVDRFDAEDYIHIYYRELKWDTNFFGIPTFRVDYTELPAGVQFITVQCAFNKLRKHLSSLYPEYYLFAEVPSEDTSVIAGMSGTGWRLIETRITCFRADIQKFDYPTRSAVRNATEADIPELRIAAKQAVNRYDRFHADDFFTPKEADDFLAIFVENSVKGFADEVIVPANGPANAFITGNYLTSPSLLSGREIGKMVLSAVTPARTGWYVRLIGELSFKFKERGIDMAFMTTQATNRTVLKVWHRHGYRFGRCTHIFSTYIRKR